MSDSETKVNRNKWSALLPLLERPGPYARTGEGFTPGEENLADLQKNARVLVVGAGGLGCEILKDLALSGFTDIHVIDLDTIDLSNLNRQFLFRMKDVGQPKAKVAAEFIMKRCKGVSVKWYNKPIQSFSSKWYSQFHFVIAGLDNVEARQWLNQTIVDLVKFDEDGEIDWGSVVFLIDGGTEGFNGQARVFVPHFTSCFECSIDSMAPPRGYPVCTIKNVPRLPEHAIMYAYQMEWPLLAEFKDAENYKLYEPKDPGDSHQPAAVKLDKDDPQHVQWIVNRAEMRAKKYGITGVTYTLAQQVIKNIIPAIASTNALISAACVNEVLKLKTLASLRLDNFFMYIGKAQTGINSEVYKYGRKPNCPVCHPRMNFTLSRNTLLKDLVKKVQEEAKMEEPIISFKGEMIYGKNLAFTHSNLEKPIFSLLQAGELALATGDDRFQKFVVKFSD